MKEHTLKEHTLNWPADVSRLAELHSGDMVWLSGTIYTARDAAHKRLLTLIEAGEPLPIDLEDAAIFYAGPSPCPPGKVSGSIGPTTSARMTRYQEQMLAAGVRLLIGKGGCPGLAQLCARYGAVYLAALGGVAADTAQRIRASEVIAWPDLGAEALHGLVVEKLPLVVIDDTYGIDYYQELVK